MAFTRAYLEKRGVPKVAIADLARDDMYECVEDAFRYDKLVLATTTYNAEIFPYMREFINMLVERGYQKRTIGFIENGSWAPMAMKVMKSKLEGLKNISYTENNVTILSALMIAGDPSGCSSTIHLYCLCPFFLRLCKPLQLLFIIKVIKFQFRSAVHHKIVERLPQARPEDIFVCTVEIPEEFFL